MGTGATIGRRALIEHVKECITRTNDVSTTNDQIVKTHNDFVKIVEEKLDGPNGALTRAKAASAWCAQNEKLLNQHASQLVNLELEVSTFISGLTFWQRVRWLLFGFRPVPSEAKATVTVSTNPNWTREQPRAWTQPTAKMVREPIRPATLGPRVLP